MHTQIIRPIIDKAARPIWRAMMMASPLYMFLSIYLIIQVKKISTKI